MAQILGFCVTADVGIDPGRVHFFFGHRFLGCVPEHCGDDLSLMPREDGEGGVLQLFQIERDESPSGSGCGVAITCFTKFAGSRIGIDTLTSNAES